MVQKSLEPQKARQGRLGWPVLGVLVAALVLLMIGWFFVEIWGEATDTPSPATQTEVNPD